MGEKLYFVDGYHGGIEGHMPVGSWEDILDAMEKYPEWKLSLEIEPQSWEYLRLHDNDVYQRLQHFVSDKMTADRVEFIGGSYGQPFCWAINGESNIRQLIRGIEVIQEHFKQVVVDTYAVQEPCFTSALPQILKKLGYQRMSLKNPTAWGGYMAPMSGGMIHLYSADGSYLPAVPRYDCEELVSCSATEGAGYEYSIIRDFAEKCVKHGIKHPIGMCLQDLGWSSRPLLQGIPVEYVTWKEYFERFKEDLQGEAKFSQEAVLCTLPWGNLTLQKMTRQVRALENRTLQIEKLLALAEIDGAVFTSGRDKLKKAWDCLMLSQHHDGFICATTGEGLKSWAFRADYLTVHGQKLLTEVEEEILDHMQEASEDQGTGNAEHYVRVYNTLGVKRTDQAEITIALPSGYHDLTVYDENGMKCASEWQLLRKHRDESIAAAKLFFTASVEGIGYSTYRVCLLNKQPEFSACIAKPTIQNTISVETSELSVLFDLTRGGAIVRLYDKELQKDFVTQEGPIGILKGYMVDKDVFVSNGECLTKHELLINGPIYTKLKLFGQFDGISFETIVEIREGDKKIDITSTAVFHEEMKIGYPYAPQKGEEYYGTKRSSCREDYKLGIRIPLPMEEMRIIKHAPYENYESQLKDTRFDGWDEIKNNMVHQYIDFYDIKANCGIGILCDHITGYSLVENQFSLTQAFGYHAGFWWGYQPLKGKSQISYSIITHQGNYEKGDLPLYNERKNEPFMVQQLSKKPARMNFSVVCFDDPSFEVVTILHEEERTMLRVFNHSSDAKVMAYTHQIPGFSGRKTDLYGKLTEDDCRTAKVAEIITLI